jgi:hypothetical protein
MMIDKVIVVMTHYRMQLERAQRLAEERVSWCRDSVHLRNLARVCRARGGRLVLRAEQLEAEAELLEDRHPHYLDEPK